MKQNLWIVGLGLVIIAAFRYAYAGSSEKAAAWALSTVIMVTGGIVLGAAFLSYHTLSGNKN